VAKITSELPNPESILRQLQKFDEIRKSNTAVVGLEVVRQDLEDDLKLAANLDTPVRNRISRKKGNGKAHAFYKLVSNLGATQTTTKYLGTDPTGAAFTKGGLPVSIDPQYQYVSRPYSNIGDLVIVAWQDQAQDESYIDILAQQKRVKMINVGLAEEYFILNGDSGATGGLAFDGLITQIQQDGFNILDVSAGGGAALAYQQIRQQMFAIKLAGGRTRALIMSYTIMELLTQMLGSIYAIRQVGSGANSTAYKGGFSLETWDFGTGSVDLIADQYMIPDGSGLERVIFLDDATQDDKNSGNVVEMVDVDPVHYRDLQSITTAERGIVYETTMLQIGVTQYQGLLEGVNSTLAPVYN
jgi:hypothetical protein